MPDQLAKPLPVAPALCFTQPARPGFSESASDFSERRCSDTDMLQHMLEVESSRQRLERYAQELSRLAEYSAYATREAQQVAQKKGDLLATLSHEIRTPLNGILGMANLLKARNLGSIELEYIDVIRQAGDSLLALVDDILDFSKIEAERLHLECSEFNVRQTVQDALRLVQPSADRKTLTLVSDIAADVPVAVYGDALRIRQILLNLLSNAIKFTNEGPVTLRIEAVGSAFTQQGLRFTVTDKGIGISPDGQARLFQPFIQANPSIARQFGGTGLGLAICKRLAEMMGGSIGLTSEEGVGSSFWFTIQTQTFCPVVPTPPPVPAQQVESVPRQARILLVEDNAINQKVAMLMLKKLGLSATVAESGLQAVQAASAHQYDFILMDCLMPEMDGFQATRAIRQGPNQGSTIPIVAMTANAFAQDREACLAAGMSDYLSKPFREVDLQAMLTKWLGGDACKARPQTQLENLANQLS